MRWLRVPPPTPSRHWTTRFIDNGPNDQLAIRNSANTAALPFGLVSLNGRFVVSGNVDFTGSTMTRAGNTITVTLGTPSGAVRTDSTNLTPSWAPSGVPTDLAGNPATTTTVVAASAVLF